VQQQPKHIRTSSRMTCRRTDQPACDSQGHESAERQVRRRHVEQTGNEPSNQYRNGE